MIWVRGPRIRITRAISTYKIMKAKSKPPYRVIGIGLDTYVVDAENYLDVKINNLSMEYHEIYGEEIMQIICEALNRKERS